MKPLPASEHPLAFAVARVAFLIACCGFLFGYSTASIAGWLEPIAAHYDLSIGGQEYFTASLVMACFGGALAAAPLARTFGRRPALMIAFLLAVGGYGIILLAPGLAWVIVARIMIGFAVGISSTVAPMYAGEATPPERRGGVVALFQLAVTLGILGAYAVPLWLEDANAWPMAIGSGLIIGVLGLGALTILPESPLWLEASGQHARARVAAAALGVRDQQGSAAAPRAQSRHPASLRERIGSLRQGATMAVLALCCTMFILQNLSGIDGILYYAPAIFIELGFPAGVAALGATFGLGLVNVVATVVAILMVDRLGRRPLAIYGSAVMVTGLCAVVAANVWDLPLLGLSGLCVYLAAFAISLGPLPYVLMAEMVPSDYRESGLSAASATSWLFNALVAFFFLSGVSTFGLATMFALFAVICVLALAVSIIWVPETRGCSLEDIEMRVMAGGALRRLGGEN